MSTDSPWSDLSLVEFCDGLADGEAGAAGARAAAVLAAAGAALAAGAQRGNPDADGSVYAVGRADELDALRERVLGRMEVQRDIFQKLTSGLERDELEKWKKRRVEVVVETVELAVAALRIAVVGAPETSGEFRTDLEVAAGVLASAAQAVDPEVRRSVDELTDQEWGRRHSMAADSLRAEAAALLLEVHTEACKS